MRKTLFTAVEVMVFLLFISHFDAFAQDRGPQMMGGMPGIRGIVRILEDAGYPLTEDQIKSIRETLQTRGIWAGIADILTPEQEQALESAQQERARVREERLENMRNAQKERVIAQLTYILEKAGCPLTEDQITQLKAIEPGTRIGTALVNILTDEQEAALLDARRQQIRQLPERERFGPRPGMPGMRGRGMLRPGDFGASGSDVTGETTGTDEEGAAKETAVETQPTFITGINQNFPNPFNPSTTIEYTLSEPGNARLDIFNTNGQLIETLVDGWQEVGSHLVVWDASSQANGIYFARITAGSFHDTRKMLFIK